jgi:hypothetical protein
MRARRRRRTAIAASDNPIVRAPHASKSRTILAQVVGTLMAFWDHPAYRAAEQNLDSLQCRGQRAEIAQVGRVKPDRWIGSRG